MIPTETLQKLRELAEAATVDPSVVCHPTPGMLLALLDEIERCHAIFKAQDARVGPRVDDDAVAVAKRWNGDSGNAEPNFDMSPEDTASFLASRVITMSEQLTAATRERDDWRQRAETQRDNNLAVLRERNEVCADYTEQIARVTTERDAARAEVEKLERRWKQHVGPIEADRECLREQLAAVSAARDDERALHARLSAEYHDATRKTCNSLAQQLTAMTAARDELAEIAEYLDTYVPKFPAEGGPTQTQRRIANLRLVGKDPNA